jgi:hypothetical protein
MLTPPVELLNIIVVFVPLFSKPVFDHLKLLLVGAILATGKPTLTACLRIIGKSSDKNFQTYHRVLNCAR